MTRLYVAAMAITMCGLANAATINVPGDQPTIAAAISASVNGDVINIAAGTYNEHSLNTGGKAITIRGTLNGDGTLATTIDAQQGGIVFVIDSGEGDETVIKDLVITGGHAFGLALLPNQGAGISCYNESNPTISGCTIVSNAALNGGGGIFCENSNPTITDCTISNNTTTAGGGIYCTSSSPTISGCTISANTANNAGGVYLRNNSNPTISGCTISGNSATYLGGGIICTSSSPTISGCTISGNTVNGDGGGISCSQSSNPTISGCTISDNFAGDFGGGLYVASSASCGVQDTTICSNIPTDPQVFGDYTDNGSNTIAEVCPWYQGACCTGNDLACVVATEQDCERFGHTWLGEGTACDDSPCPIACLGDVTGDSQVSVNDVLTVIGNWGPCP